MRLIGTVATEFEAARITSYLKEKGIESSTDFYFDTGSGHMTHQIWVVDEDQIKEAISYFEQFSKKPMDPEYDAKVLPIEKDEPLIEEKIKVRPRTPLTTLLIALCVAIFMLNYFEEISMKKENLNSSFFVLTPIQALLLYDLPKPLENLETFVEKHTSDESLENLAPDVSEKTKEIDQTPFFRGFAEIIVLKIKGKDTTLATGPLFTKIKEGEVWRLLTPAFLHTQLLHILFNMIWLVVLGRPIEERLKIGKTLTLTLIIGIVSNTVQYLMGGPFFLGYSGIVMGLAGFIWMREKHFPWEGYPFSKTTFFFLLLFVVAMFALSMASFFMDVFANTVFAPNIANSAHIAGGIVGIILGRLSWFSWKLN